MMDCRYQHWSMTSHLRPSQRFAMYVCVVQSREEVLHLGSIDLLKTMKGLLLQHHCVTVCVCVCVCVWVGGYVCRGREEELEFRGVLTFSLLASVQPNCIIYVLVIDAWKTVFCRLVYQHLDLLGTGWEKV